MSATKKLKNVLLFGGGGCHDFKSCCPILEGYLGTIKTIKYDYVAEDYDVFTAKRIKQYDTVVIYHTGGQLNTEQKRGLVEWCAAGGGVVGIHGAADSFKNSPEYLAMLGGVFKAHPFSRKYIIGLNDEHHPAVKHIRGYAVEFWEKWPVFEFEVEDEQYLLDYDSRVTVLASTIFRGRQWPVVWTKPWGDGKVFYIALGHNPSACENKVFKKLFVGGVRWVLNPQPGPEPPTNKFAIS